MELGGIYRALGKLGKHHKARYFVTPVLPQMEHIMDTQEKDIAERLLTLCHPNAESMSDYDRINAFVSVGNEAADEIERLRQMLFITEQKRDLERQAVYRAYLKNCPPQGQQRGNKKDKVNQAADAIRKLCLD